MVAECPHSRLQPPVLDTDAVSDRSCRASLLEPRDLRPFDAAPVQPGTEPLEASTNRNESTDGLHKQVSVESKNFLKKAKSLKGWRMGLALCAATACTVFIINLILAVWALSKYGLKKGGIGTIQEGSCKTTRRLSLWLHLVINVLSTLLLGASNYCMQCLASPTRHEVDRAHRQEMWLDIGVPSVRNLTRISPCRIILWWLLIISGVPLHLFYNSAVFSTLSFQPYYVYAASPDLVSQKDLNWSIPIDLDRDRSGSLGFFRNVSTWQQLDNAACIRAYAQPFVSAHGNLVAVSAGVNNSTLIEFVNVGGSFAGADYSWICQIYESPDPCDVHYLLSDASNWRVFNIDNNEFLVQYCLSQPVEERCRVQFSMIIVGIVMACNILKTLCILLAMRQRNSRPLVTLGDAIEEFLVKPDWTTYSVCLSGKRSFSPGLWGDAPSRWDEKGHRWFSSLSTQRWVICNFL